MTYRNNGPHVAGWRPPERLNARKMQDEEARPEQKEVEQTHQPKKERHVDTILVADPPLHDGDVEAVYDGADKRHGVANGNLRLRLVREVAAVLVAGARQVHRRDEHDAHQAGQHAHQLAVREALDAHDGAEDERPDAAGRRQDRHAADARVLEAG